MFHLSDPLSTISGVGPTYVRKLKTMGVETIRDLLFYFPFRYDDFQEAEAGRFGQLNTKIIVECEVISIVNIFTRNRKKLTTAIVKDKHGLLSVVWFNQHYLTKAIRPGMFIKLTGKLQEFNRMPTLMSPQWQRSSELVVLEDDDATHSKKPSVLVPIYSETFGVTSKWIREKVQIILRAQLEMPEEYLPRDILDRNELLGLERAIRYMHSPAAVEEVERAKRRFSYEELFAAQLRSSIQRQEWKNQKVEFSLKVEAFRPDIERVVNSLPFELTGGQQNSIGEIFTDLEKPIPMNRLLEGDVGSGKTVVAALACFVTYLNGYKSLIMTPTQILATQHYDTLQRVLTPFGVKVALVVGGKKNHQQNADIYVGTHALIHSKHTLERVALTIIDEQHRFGVAQRATLRSKHGLTHILSMTATPIPRTLALTLYGDLDLSVIDEMPKGRKPVKTWVVPQEKRVNSYEWITKFISETKEQVFIVCPFIEPSESDTTVKAAVEEFERLRKEVFPAYRICLLHGGMKADEKDTVLLAFRNKEYDIMVCTPVVEVGIDIPSASIVVIESADRFGLAQLHQFRGRVGRAGQQAYCLLFPSSQKQEDSKRLKALETTNSGLKLAEIDLELRGVGNIFGFEQSGKSLFKYADFFNVDLIKKAKNDAEQLLEADPYLSNHPLLLDRVKLPINEVGAN